MRVVVRAVGTHQSNVRAPLHSWSPNSQPGIHWSFAFALVSYSEFRGPRLCGRLKKKKKSLDSGAMGDQADNVKHVEAPIPSLAEEEAIMKKKYGGLMPKKPPLISKDHERAFFDSADWALGKQGKAPPGQKPRSLMETLRPKLQPSPHHSAPHRRSSLLAADGEGEGHVDGEGQMDTEEPVNGTNGVPRRN